jgi:hypothetical protein
VAEVVAMVEVKKCGRLERDAVKTCKEKGKRLLRRMNTDDTDEQSAKIGTQNLTTDEHGSRDGSEERECNSVEPR